MNQEQQDYISLIDNASDGNVYIKHTCREGINLQSHRHSRHQLVYTLSGTLHIQTGNMSYFLPEKHLASIPAGVEHELSSNNRQIELLIFYYDEANQRGGSSKLSIYNVNAFLLENLRFIAGAGEIINLRDNPDLYAFAIGFFRLIPVVSPHCEIPLQSLIVPGDDRLRPVLQYIAEHIGDDITLGHVAAYFGFSVRNLSRMFRKENLRFCTYLNYRRITRAIELFAAHDLTFQQIAYEVGFSSPGNFTRVFKQLLGVTPKEFLAGSTHLPRP